MRRTGMRIKINRSFFRDTWSVMEIYTYVLKENIGRFLLGIRPKGTIAFSPQPIAPWFTAWAITQLAGYKIIANPAKADHIFVFDDSTYTDVDSLLPAEIRSGAINYGIKNIAKQHVADVFADVFGYSLSIDPVTYQELAIRKSEENAAHDGIVIQCPIDPSEVLSGYAYQRLIDSTFNGKTSEDLRIAFVLGEVSVAFQKHKEVNKRFSTEYLSVDAKEPIEVFSLDEIGQITEFCKKIGLDFGAVDIMRDKHDRRIYIVDVNKTCMPVLFLDFKRHKVALKRISDAFEKGLQAVESKNRTDNQATDSANAVTSR